MGGWPASKKDGKPRANAGKSWCFLAKKCRYIQWFTVCAPLCPCQLPIFTKLDSLRKNLGSGLPDMPVRRTTAALPQVRRLLSTTQPILRIILSIYHFNSFHHFVFNKLVSSRNVILQMMCPNSRNTSGVGGCGSCAGPGARRDTSRRSDIRLGILSWHRCGFDLFFFGWYVLLFDVWLRGKNQPRAQRTKLLFKSNQQPSQH